MNNTPKLYRVYDTVICDYVGMPFTANNAAHAKRMIADALEKSDYSKHAADYILREFPLQDVGEDVCRLDALFTAPAEV